MTLNYVDMAGQRGGRPAGLRGTTKKTTILLIKKSLTAAGYLSTHEYELSAHLVCFNNSYYLNAHVALCCMGVCCNSPLLGRKGVSYDEVF